ncbi:MAG: efflux RND transporter periplasmic adaptor subunit [Puniceicoccales bacterium]|jgi:HlyD family secretion protein|nr:efflux RND transporter periplasmic adaptor subunit [Puniceicoccales bacterium]
MTTPSNTNSPDLGAILEADATGGKKTKWRLFALLLVLAAAAVGGWEYWRQHEAARNTGTDYVTVPVRRGDISLDITATGNLEPTNEVTVGSELSGITLQVLVDTNDHVTAKQVLARLDTAKLFQQTAISRATLASARARVAQATAVLTEANAALARAKKLHTHSEGRLPSAAEMDTAQATADRAAADLDAAKAVVDEASAQIAIHETDLGKAEIKSPIDGIVLKRNIEQGQTVAASFTAPELFVIAEKLEHMKLNVAVAEADIGRVAKDQRATFTVDAWPNRHYDAKVLKVAYGSEVKDNVVTYETELEVANNDLSLRPGMTATADIHVAEHKDVFLVPTAALRFDPDRAQSPTSPSAAPNKTFVQSLIPGPPRRGGSRRGPQAAAAGKTEIAPDGTARIWILRDGKPVPLTVKVGLTDGRQTEISGEGVVADLPVITRAGR